MPGKRPVCGRPHALQTMLLIIILSWFGATTVCLNADVSSVPTRSPSSPGALSAAEAAPSTAALKKKQDELAQRRHRVQQLLEAAAIAFPQRDVHLDSLKPIEVNIRQPAQEESYELRRSDAA